MCEKNPTHVKTIASMITIGEIYSYKGQKRWLVTKDSNGGDDGDDEDGDCCDDGEEYDSEDGF